MGVSITVQNLPKVQAFIKKLDPKVTLAVQSAIKQSGFFIQSEVVESVAGHRAEPTSVDTGRFKNSVQTKFPKPMEAVVNSGVKYSKQLEYGTSKMNGRHHFRNTAKRNENKIKDFVNKKIKAVI